MTPAASSSTCFAASSARSQPFDEADREFLRLFARWVGATLERLQHEEQTREARRFQATRPRSKAALDRGAAVYLDGVPLHWMKDWPMPHLPLVEKAHGAVIEDHPHEHGGP